MKTLYTFLGVKQTATADDIKAAYVKRLKEVDHRHEAGDPDAPLLKTVIQDAYRVLSSPEKRGRYDTGLANRIRNRQEGTGLAIEPNEGKKVVALSSAPQIDSTGSIEPGETNSLPVGVSASAPAPYSRETLADSNVVDSNVLLLFFIFVTGALIGVGAIAAWFWLFESSASEADRHLIMAGVGLFLGLYCAIGVSRWNKRAQKAQHLVHVIEQNLKNLADFSLTDYYFSIISKTGLAFDEVRKTVCLIILDGDDITLEVIQADDVLSSELMEDGVTTTKTDRASQLGGALAGSLLLGGVGAVIGGLSGATQTSDRTSRLVLRLTINNVQKPFHEIVFFKSEKPVEKRTDASYQAAIQSAARWQAIIEIMLKRSAKQEESNNRTISATTLLPNSCSTERLEKLVDLLESGLITNEEFLKLKTRLQIADSNAQPPSGCQGVSAEVTIKNFEIVKNCLC
ncbi:DnaJ domain-containing protein [Methylococcus sp. EFPC2]|uniref:DnaJ domain-containing protein n=1 Tax=Methylococcus sp. EFPC2 TaxID=2812648 RepID=UPI00196737D1|nr:DnaJ domain-containing protein [Methylococcus sp. EFPC2]QSA98812.1 DnaJ domain-containing protein [Methylococcus sp. EFPC2]